LEKCLIDDLCGTLNDLYHSITDEASHIDGGETTSEILEKVKNLLGEDS